MIQQKKRKKNLLFFPVLRCISVDEFTTLNLNDFTPNYSNCCSETWTETLGTLCLLRCTQKQSRTQGRNQGLEKSNRKSTKDVAPKSYILFFLKTGSWQHQPHVEKSFITLGRNQTINNGLLCQNCAGLRRMMDYQEKLEEKRTSWCRRRRISTLMDPRRPREMWIMRF